MDKELAWTNIGNGFAYLLHIPMGEIGEYEDWYYQEAEKNAIQLGAKPALYTECGWDDHGKNELTSFVGWRIPNTNKFILANPCECKEWSGSEIGLPTHTESGLKIRYFGNRDTFGIAVLGSINPNNMLTYATFSKEEVRSWYFSNTK